MRQVVLYPGENGYWVAECPSLPGCVSQGKTKDEAVTNIREAREGYLLALQQDGLTVPPDHCDAVRVAAGKFIP
jgi:predicted RNase H-like HicB family nuclease